ncbi:MAG: hypothetical protein H6Q37_1423 [Chloroflexi bacterium]|nr:hypothetical protein [Chloroflexota bacterium]
MGFAGIDTIKAATFSYAGVEDRPFIQRQIRLALGRFEGVLAINAVEELVETYRGRPVFRNNMVWPSIYDLRLLAFTQNWRSLENQVMIGDSIGRLVRLSPLLAASVRYRSQLIAPAPFCMDDFNPDLSTMDDAQWMMWLYRMERLARLGIVPWVYELNQQVDALREILDANTGKFAKRLVHDYFRRWYAHSGLMLEKDWRDPHRHVND